MFNFDDPRHRSLPDRISAAAEALPAFEDEAFALCLLTMVIGSSMALPGFTNAR